MEEKTPIKKQSYPHATAILAGLLAGIVAGLIAYLVIGLPGFIIAFIVGAITGSRMTLIANRSRERES